MTSTYTFTTIATPVGPFSVAVDALRRVVGSAFGTREALARRLPGAELHDDPEPPAAAVAQVREYFAGARQQFDLPCNPAGTPYQRRVWELLARIPFGETRSYAALARKLRSSPRAVGGANSRNPICLLVPCHRVIGAQGALTGFAFGTAIKQALLEHEARWRRERVDQGAPNTDRTAAA